MRAPLLVAFVCALAASMLVGLPPVLAVKNIVIDWERGEVTETVDPVDEEEGQEELERFVDGQDSDEDHIERLRKAVSLQQKVILRQRALISELKEENLRFERRLLGYDQLLRRCR